MKQIILTIDENEDNFKFLNNEFNYQVKLAKCSKSAIAEYSSTEQYIGLSLINITQPTSLVYSDNEAIKGMLKVKNLVLPTVAYYNAGKVSEKQLELFKEFQQKGYFSLILELEQLKKRIKDLESLFRPSFSDIIFENGSIHTPDKPQLAVSVIEADRHAITILSSYGGLLAASLTEENQAERIIRTLSLIGIDAKVVGGWLIVLKNFYRSFKKAV